MKDYYKNVIKTITDAVDSLSDLKYEELINSCVNTIKCGGKIIASGLGKNVPICEKFVGTMVSLGLPSCFMNTNTAMHGDIGYIQDSDLLIVLSKSGNTAETLALVQYLSNRKNDSWLFTCGENTKSQKYTKHSINFKLDNEGDEWNIVPNNSCTVFLIVLQGIAIEIAKRLNVKLEDFKVNHPGGSIGEILK